MGVVMTDAIGTIVTVVGWDGTDFYTLKVDTDGKLQMAATVEPPEGGFATETTLTNIDARIGDDESPAAGTVNAQLADLVTRMGAPTTPAAGTVNAQLADIVDRLGATSDPDLGTVNAWLSLIKAVIDDINTHVGDNLGTDAAEIKDRLGDETSPAAGTVNKQLATLITDLTVKNKQYYDSVYRYTGNASADSGTLTINSDAVGAGKILEVESITIWLSAGTATIAQVSLIMGAGVYPLRRESTTVLNQGYAVYGPITLLAEEYIRAVFTAVGNGSTGNLAVVGRQYAAS